MSAYFNPLINSEQSLLSLTVVRTERLPCMNVRQLLGTAITSLNG